MTSKFFRRLRLLFVPSKWTEHMAFTHVTSINGEQIGDGWVMRRKHNGRIEYREMTEEEARRYYDWWLVR